MAYDAPWQTSAALAAAGAGGAALGLAFPTTLPLAFGLCAGWGAVASWRLGARAGLAALPGLALVPGVGGWGALIGWTAAAAVAGVLRREEVIDDAAGLRSLRNELRDAEHERQLLHRHIQRYPVLLEACMELSAARGLDQLAVALVARVRALVSRLDSVRVYLGGGEDPLCLASSDAFGKPCPGPPGRDERYVALEARTLIRREGDRVHVLIPLRGDRRRAAERESLRGVLAVVFTAGEAGSRLDLELLSALARLGGLGLAAVDLLEQARSLALHDELTGLFGQHEFLRRLDELASSTRRHRQPLGVVMVDLDHLKKFNDRHGHAIGDLALKAVAGALRLALPPGALVCRYGGEEFALALPGVDARTLAATAEIVRLAISQARLDGRRTEVKVTGSVGWAMLGADEGPRAALARADAACYRAKANGRNRVEAATEDAAEAASGDTCSRPGDAHGGTAGAGTAP
ncbi:MAG TPA: GGDEF domain-containing protein [Planctomycetota bacterium]|nr:GGDEF domain-containing protein [Planctomycetota bacterium]